MGDEDTRTLRTVILMLCVVVAVVLLVAMGTVNGQNREGRFVRGDYDLSGTVCMNDAVGLIRFLIGVDCYPLCEDAADANDDSVVDLSDAIWILDTVFIDGSRWKSLTCGPDNTYDALYCEYDSYTCEGSSDYINGY